MGTKVVKVTFPDGTRMYGTYSTVSDQIESDLVSLSVQDEIYDSDIVSDALHAASKLYPIAESAADEIVQCEVLLYGDSSWVSKAKRGVGVGVITGVPHGEEYIGDWQEAAEQMDRERSAGSGAGTKQRQSWLKRLFKLG